jgi:hypothetical protein
MQRSTWPVSAVFLLYVPYTEAEVQRSITLTGPRPSPCDSVTLTLHELTPTDSFDLESFFKIHDLDQDGVLNADELEAIYGLHHETSKEGNGEHHPARAQQIVDTVMSKLDLNGDGVVTKTEFTVAGRDGLPDFRNVEGLGHHYGQGTHSCSSAHLAHSLVQIPKMNTISTYGCTDILARRHLTRYLNSTKSSTTTLPRHRPNRHTAIPKTLPTLPRTSKSKSARKS